MLLHSIHLRNILSFGPGTPKLSLGPLNVLIGPNGSGKSNLIECINLLRHAPTDLTKPIREGGGVTEWLWKGNQGNCASIESEVSISYRKKIINHSLVFSSENQRFLLNQELIQEAPNPKKPSVSEIYSHLLNGRRVLRTKGKMRSLPPNAVRFVSSFLSQFKDPFEQAEIAYLADRYENMLFYRDWMFGHGSILRQPTRVDMPNDYLSEDGSNLGLVLNRLRGIPETKRKILEYLRDLFDGIMDFDVSIEGGTVQVFLQENNITIPAIRLSDGTLRYLCLLAILCHPKPPPLICIEEPELGLHPDIIPKVADLLIEASQRSQLLVTTHSDILVDALTEQPESVIVCEKDKGETTMTRLDERKLKVWLEKYRLGQLWIDGQLGGKRW